MKSEVWHNALFNRWDVFLHYTLLKRTEIELISIKIIIGKMLEKDHKHCMKAQTEKRKTPTGWDISSHEVQTRMCWPLEQIMKVFRLLRKICAWREIIIGKMVKIYAVIVMCSLLLESWLSSGGMLTLFPT